jgi:hypothetical protein
VDSGLGDRSADVIGERIQDRVAMKFESPARKTATEHREDFRIDRAALGESGDARMSISDTFSAHFLDGEKMGAAPDTLLPAMRSRLGFLHLVDLLCEGP